MLEVEGELGASPTFRLMAVAAPAPAPAPANCPFRRYYGAGRTGAPPITMFSTSTTSS
jgi:hypothetical protein